MQKNDAPPKQKNNASKKALVGFALVFLTILALSPVVLEAYQKNRLTECKTNLRDLGTAMEMYSTDWNGHYPTDLEKLKPKYMAEIPVCPNSDGGYQVKLGPNAPGNEPNFEDYFYIFCEGLNHEEAGVGKDQPAFDPMGRPREPEF
jgi:hypothetical protein